MPTPHPLLPLDVQERYRAERHWEGITLADIVRDWAAKEPRRPAVVGPHPLSYGELWEQARRVAGTLSAAGLDTGDYLLAALPSSWQGVVVEVACSVIGAPLAARSGDLSPALARNVFDQLDVKGLVLNDELLAKPEWRECLNDLRARLEGRPVLLVSDIEDAAENGPLAEQATVDTGAPCIVLSTGGTTGVPKSILHSNDTLVYASRNFGAACRFTGEDVVVAFAPYGHAAGSVLDIYMPLLYGAKILPSPRWKARPVAELIDQYGGTFFITMGTHIFDLVTLDPPAAPLLRSVRLLPTGAGADALFEDGERELGVRLVRVYGCSECPGHAIGRSSDTPEIRLREDGVPFPGLETRILDPSGNPVPDGVPGAYECRGPNLFLGYAGQPELTAQTVTDDGFYRSGDLIVRNPRTGYISWNGRTKDIIRRAGLQIDPVEMENMLGGHPAVSSVVVVGEPHARLGERAVVVAVPEPGQPTPALDDLCAYLTGCGLPKQSLPERLVLTDEIPRTAVGKFHRAEVKRRLVEEPESLTAGSI